VEESVRLQQARLRQASRTDAHAEGEFKVGYQGAEGSYSSLAVRRHFSIYGERLTICGFETFKALLDAVHEGRVAYGLLPLENTTAGSINQAYDLLYHMDLAIVGEEVQEVNHCLLALQDVPLSEIRRVCSQAPALSQCTSFLSALSDCHIESVKDTAMAVAKVAREGDTTQAAIASEEAGRLHGLKVLRRGIANQAENFTRFVVVARRQEPVDLRMRTKTSLLLATRDEEGALLRCLDVFARHHLNLVKLESRPRPNVPWEYLFYVDFIGNLASPSVAMAMEALRDQVRFLKIFGSYPERTGRQSTPLTSDASLSQLESTAQRPEWAPVQLRELSIGGGTPVMLGQVDTATSATALNFDELRMQGVEAVVLADAVAHEVVSGCVTAGRKQGVSVVATVTHRGDVAQLAPIADGLLVPGDHMGHTEVLDALGRVDCPVLLVRGDLASVSAWMEALRRIRAGGNQQVVLVTDALDDLVHISGVAPALYLSRDPDDGANDAVGRGFSGVLRAGEPWARSDATDSD
jgi:chorismate mutase/prephenate dehydratase